MLEFVAAQIPNEYEGANGEKLQAIPMGEREGHEPATTGVELDFAIHPDAPLEIRAVSAEEVEAKQREEEAAAKKRQEEEAASKKHQEEEAAARRRQEEEAAATAKRRREQQRAKAKRLRRHRLLRRALKRCAKFESKHRRTRCVRRARTRYGHHKGHGKHKTTHRAHRRHHSAAADRITE